MKLFFDTNIFLRFFITESPRFNQECIQLIDFVKRGVIAPYTSNVVLLEFQCVLLKTYKQPKQTIIRDINSILDLRNLHLIENTDFKKAIKYYQNHNVKFGDCLIATQIPPNCHLCTYDEDFRKISSLSIITPAQAIKKLQITKSSM